jgi:hypothetical protein
VSAATHRRGFRFRLFAAAALVAAVPCAARAAVITIVNANQAGVGFNDPTPATPVGGNNGTTVGQQALNAFQHAANIWGALLDDDVEIKIRASFEPLDCDASTGTLGAAGPTGAVSDFPNAPIAGTWYPSALANRIAGQPLRGSTEDIQARFNSKLGTTGCLEGTSWYYGFDGNHGSGFDLVAVLLHEFAHGLGFLTLVDDGDWSEFNGAPDVFETHILDVEAGKHWNQMSDSERLASAVRTDKIVWDGIAVQSQTPSTLDPLPSLGVLAPASIAGNYQVGTADFGADVTVAGLSGVLVQATDPSDASGTLTTDGCSTITNASEVAGKIALIDRGTCAFVDKATHAQAAGAIGLVVVNNAAGVVQMGGDAASVTIPVVSISQDDGTAIRAQLSAGVQAKIFANSRLLAGAGLEGRMLLYAPNPVEQGSSISHWDTSAKPNLLMEPNLSSDLPHTVDLTLPLLRDIGWASDSGPAAGPRLPASRVQETDAPRVVVRP